MSLLFLAAEEIVTDDYELIDFDGSAMSSSDSKTADFYDWPLNDGLLTNCCPNQPTERKTVMAKKQPFKL